MTNTARIVQLLELHRFQEAHDLASESLAHQPDDAYTYHLLARALTGLKRGKDGYAANEQALALDPTLADGFWLRGLYKEARGKFREAAEAHETSLALAPNSLKFKGDYIHTILETPIESRLGRPNLRLSRARQLADSMLQSAPNHEYPHLMSARVHLAQKEIPQAHAAVLHALQINPGYAAAHHVLGKIQQRNGDLQRAGDAYVMSGRLDPRSSESRDELAQVAEPKPLMLAWLACAVMLFFFGKESAWVQDNGLEGLLLIIVLGTIISMVLWKRRQVNSLSPQAKQVYESTLPGVMRDRRPHK